MEFYTFEKKVSSDGDLVRLCGGWREREREREEEEEEDEKRISRKLQQMISQEIERWYMMMILVVVI